jgi:hypothetical protein
MRGAHFSSEERKEKSEELWTRRRGAAEMEIKEKREERKVTRTRKRSARLEKDARLEAAPPGAASSAVTSDELRVTNAAANRRAPPGATVAMNCDLPWNVHSATSTTDCRDPTAPGAPRETGLRQGIKRP